MESIKNMKKWQIVLAMLALTVIVGSITVYKTQELEFAGGGIKQVTTSGLDITVLACNPSPLPQTIDLMQAVLYSQSNNLGTFEVTGTTIPPYSQAEMDGTFTFQDFSSLKNFIGWIVNNQNPEDFQATLLVKTKILGVIPYSYKKSYDLASFEDMFLGSSNWSCQKQGVVQPSDIKQQLSLTQERLNAADLLYLNEINSTNSTNP